MADYTHVRAGHTAQAQIDEGLRAHMNKVYGIMSVGMVITAAAAWAIANLAMQDGQPTALGNALFNSPLRWAIMFAPLLMVFAFGALINRLSAAGAQVFFYCFAALMGVSISWIFIAFELGSVVQVFLITAIAFAGLSLWGYTTKKDISGWGSFLIMGLIGLIVASIVNIFLDSDGISFAISMIGVLIFAGLTAYDTQKIKTDYIQNAIHMNSEWLAKSAIMGALNLYLDFINMFMMLLNLLGNRE